MINEDPDNEQSEGQHETEESVKGLDFVKVMAIGFAVFVYFVIYLKILFIP
ncbi:MAG TPA: hypothetical protein VD927_00980 [Chryseosolibacter sp.]|nr:hypothetical protein [Chryseosolibacter sp.]